MVVSKENIGRLFFIPVGGRKGDWPETGRGQLELESYGEIIRAGLFDAYYAAVLFFASFGIEENQRLAGQHFRFQFHQAAVGVDDECLRFFVHLAAIGSFALNGESNLKHDAFAAAAIGRIVGRKTQSNLRRLV